MARLLGECGQKVKTSANKNAGGGKGSQKDPPHRKVERVGDLKKDEKWQLEDVGGLNGQRTGHR